MPKSSPLGLQVERAFAANSEYKADPSGHSEYLLRYRTATGIPFAIGRTARAGVRIWLPADDRFKAALEKEGYTVTRSEPNPSRIGSHGTGRNSNLDRIPEFKGRSLYWTKVATPGEALSVVSKLK
jgi:hypothetical protein